MHRCCPACTRRHAQLIDPRCPICGGTGVLRLGPAALALHEPEVVSQAVAIALEAEARDVDLKLTYSDDRLTPLRGTMKQLIDAGILLQGGLKLPNQKSKQLPKADTARDLAAQITDVIIVETDDVLINAPHYEYSAHERPNARGLPALSANGHPSHLARVTDPAEPGASTSEIVAGRATQRRQATILARAVPETVKLKKRNRKRAEQ
ncbi:hypothetical protein SEA_EASTWEST_73 [Arthrobacter phage EastWest]|uniref:Uncharacterized protein n=1 Tax=Arthrobacter phage EastWest TaxID=2894292 RepID=A0AAE8YK67_9CAUD|nr:hypothetical protein SEA_EASTWEST_73 [Arthrobacter phage EastWest]